MKKFLVSLLACVIGFVGTVSAQDATKQPNILSLTVETYFTTNAHDIGTKGNESSISQDWYFDFKLPQDYVLEAYIGGTKQVEGGSTDGSMADSYLQLEKAVYKSDLLKFSLSGRYIAPTSENSRNNTDMNWGMQLRPTFLFYLYKNGEMNLTFRSRPTINNYYYSNDTNKSGYYNYERVFVWANRFHFDVKSWLYLQAHFNYKTYWNTNGDHVDDKWDMTQLIGFNLSENMYLEFFHESGGRLYNANGQRESVDVFDSKTSTYTCNFGITF